MKKSTAKRTVCETVPKAVEQSLVGRKYKSSVSKALGLTTFEDLEPGDVFKVNSSALQHGEMYLNADGTVSPFLGSAKRTSFKQYPVVDGAIYANCVVTLAMKAYKSKKSISRYDFPGKEWVRPSSYVLKTFQIRHPQIIGSKFGKDTLDFVTCLSPKFVSVITKNRLYLTDVKRSDGYVLIVTANGRVSSIELSREIPPGVEFEGPVFHEVPSSSDGKVEDMEQLKRRCSYLEALVVRLASDAEPSNPEEVKVAELLKCR